ncbi:MAG: glycosyl transferase family 4, partial [Armatimonadetes bacterium]|nr:glycosyl transferase family 4 [Armatimonadota bacterium]
LIFTPLVKKIAFKFKILDYPSTRKIHEFPIPRWGGLALYLSFLISISITLFLGTKFFLFKKGFLTFKSFYFLKGLFLGTTLMLILGMIDDWKNISPKIKFFF